MSAEETLWLYQAKAYADRFWSKVNKTENCWLWTRGVDKDGYGKFQLPLPNGQQKHVRAHRLAWSLANGQWFPANLGTIHSCDTPACVRPEHIRPGTQLENRRDCAAKKRTAIGQRNGKYTHPELRQRGEKHPQAKISEYTVLLVRSRVAAGVHQAQVARELGISRAIVYQITAGRTWVHVR